MFPETLILDVLSPIYLKMMELIAPGYWTWVTDYICKPNLAVTPYSATPMIRLILNDKPGFKKGNICSVKRMKVVSFI